MARRKGRGAIFDNDGPDDLLDDIDEIERQQEEEEALEAFRESSRRVKKEDGYDD